MAGNLVQLYNIHNVFTRYLMLYTIIVLFCALKAGIKMHYFRKEAMPYKNVFVNLFSLPQNEKSYYPAI